MRVRHRSGSVVDVPERKANRLVSGGSWVYVDAPPVAEPAPESRTEPEAAQSPVDVAEAEKVPTIPEMRAWAIATGVENVPARGKLPKHAIDAYRAAHEG